MEQWKIEALEFAQTRAIRVIDQLTDQLITYQTALAAMHASGSREEFAHYSVQVNQFKREVVRTKERLREICVHEGITGCELQAVAEYVYNAATLDARMYIERGQKGTSARSAISEFAHRPTEEVEEVQNIGGLLKLQLKEGFRQIAQSKFWGHAAEAIKQTANHAAQQVAAAQAQAQTAKPAPAAVRQEVGSITLQRLLAATGHSAHAN